MRRRLRLLWRDRRGAAAVFVAIAITTLLGFVGLAVDLGFAAETRAELDAAADAAVLQATRVAASAFAAGRQDFIAEGQASAQSWFAVQTGQMLHGTMSPPTISVVQQGTAFSVGLQYTAASQTYFAALFGFPSIPIGGSASATITLNAYVGIVLLLDNSSSMLIASTPSGVTQMEALTPCSAAGPSSGQLGSGTCTFQGHKQQLAAPCGFACHWSATGPDYFGLARANNVQLRFDVLQSATQSMIGTMQSSELFPGQLEIGVYTFNSALAQVYPAGGGALGNDLGAALAAVQAVTTPVVVNDGDTDFPDALAAVAPAIGTSGDGSTATKPRKNLFIVTDGLDDYGSRTLPTTQGPFPAAACDAIKQQGVTIYVLYTPYTPLPSNSYYNSRIAQFVNTPPTPNLITQGLLDCASSPADFFMASDPASITAALQAMLKAAVSSPETLKS